MLSHGSTRPAPRLWACIRALSGIAKTIGGPMRAKVSLGRRRAYVGDATTPFREPFMTLHNPAPSILEAAGVDARRAEQVLGDALAGADDGELFVERSESEFFLFDDGRLKSASYDSVEGFGLRVVAGETAGYAHSTEISEAAIGRAGKSAALAKRGYSGGAAEGPRATNAKLYGEDDPLASPGFSEK